MFPSSVLLYLGVVRNQTAAHDVTAQKQLDAGDTLLNRLQTMRGFYGPRANKATQGCDTQRNSLALQATLPFAAPIRVQK